MDIKIVGQYRRPISWPKVADRLARAMVVFVELCDVLLLPVFGILMIYLLLTMFP